MNLALYGWLSQGLLLAALLLRTLPGSRLLLIPMALGAAFLPLPEIDSLAAWLHGIFGPPSFTLLQLALLTCLGKSLPAAPGRPVGLALLGLALGFYLAALGLGPLDPYGWGFQPQYLLAALLPLLLMLYRNDQGGWLLLLTLDLMAYTLGLYANLWDALFDPILVLSLALVLAKRKSS